MSPAGQAVVPAFAVGMEQTPLLPYQGMVDAGIALVDGVGDGRFSVADFAAVSLQPGTAEYDYALGRALFAHSLADVPTTTNHHLETGLGLAMEIVQSGAVRAIALLSRGDDSVETAAIGPLDPADAEEAATFLADAGNRALVRGLFTAVKERLGRARYLQGELREYRSAIVRISQRWEDFLTHEMRSAEDIALASSQRAAELQEERGDMMNAIRLELCLALEHEAGRPGVEAFAGVLACDIPSPELVAKYIPSKVAAE